MPQAKAIIRLLVCECRPTSRSLGLRFFNRVRALNESILSVIKMKNGIKIIAALSMAFAGMMGTTALINNVAATTAVDCRCGKRLCDGRCRLAGRKSTCQSCDTQCGCGECRQCSCEFCKLELDISKVKKTCFKVEQKTICVPPVRLPWKKDCPPTTSKPKIVNVLKKHSYECPNCTCKWTLQKPEPPQVTAAGASMTNEIVTASPTSGFVVSPAYNASQEVKPWHPEPQVVYGPPSSNRR